MYYISLDDKCFSIHKCVKPPHTVDEILQICKLDKCLTGDILRAHYILDEDLSYRCLGSRFSSIVMITSDKSLVHIEAPRYLGHRFETQAPFAIGVSNHTGIYPLTDLHLVDLIMTFFSIKQDSWCENFACNVTTNDVDYKTFMKQLNEN